MNEEFPEQSLGMLLRKINIGLKRQMDKCEIKKQIDNVTGVHGYIVEYLKSRDGEDVFQRDVEKRFSMRRSTASSILALMEKNGLIERQPVSYDARLKKIVLTDKANEYITLFNSERVAVESIISQGFSEEEILLLVGMLKRVVTNVGNANNGL